MTAPEHRYRRRGRDPWRRRCICGARVCVDAELAEAAQRALVSDEVAGVDWDWISRQM